MIDEYTIKDDIQRYILFGFLFGTVAIDNPRMGSLNDEICLYPMDPSSC